MNNSNFKLTEIGKIPEKWEVVRLGDVLELCQYGLSVKMDEIGKYPIVKMDDIVNGVVVPDKVKYTNLDEITFENFKLAKGDILFNRTNSYELVGRTGIFLLSGDYVFASYLIRLRPKKETVDSHFLTFYMVSSNDRIRQQLATRAVHQANINATNLQNFSVLLPPLPEQQKIAEILSTVDTAIQKVDNAIEKTEHLKKGLMQKLLARGIGHKKFKFSKELDCEIPEKWEVARLGYIGNIITGKTPPTSNKEFWDGNIPFITPGDIKDSKYVYETERYVTIEGAKVVGMIPKNTVLVVCIGSTIGKIGMTYEESITNQQINSVLCKGDMNSHYIYYVMASRVELLKNFSGVAAVPIIKKSLFENFKILITKDLSEQQKISEILGTVDRKLELEKARKGKLERIKKGLMDDLLTGKKRVAI